MRCLEKPVRCGNAESAAWDYISGLNQDLAQFEQALRKAQQEEMDTIAKTEMISNRIIADCGLRQAKKTTLKKSARRAT